MKAFLYDWFGGNVWLFHAINDVHGALLDRFMMIGTLLGGHGNFPVYLGFLCLVAMGSVSRIPENDPIRLNEATMGWLLTICVFSIAYMLDGQLLNLAKPWLDFPRPLLALPPDTVHVVGKPEYYHSLPSGHASFAMLVVSSLWPKLKPRGRGMGIFFVLWVGFSRISLGAHFPADVLAGFLTAFLIVSAVRWVLESTLSPNIE